MVAGIYFPIYFLTKGCEIERDSSQEEARYEEFVKWLSPSNWLVEAQLHTLLNKPERSTLRWVSDMPEFAKWRTSARKSNERVLWIQGGPGVGKSTLSAYLVTVLKRAYPESIVAYFFCKAGQSGLMVVSDIVRTLAYQCTEKDATARSRLESLKRENFPIDRKIDLDFMVRKILREPLDSVSKDMYVVLDGLDEVDAETASTRNPEINVLIRTLADFCSSTKISMRLMMISRPQTDVVQVLPTVIVRTVGSKDTADDMQEYITKQLQASPLLQKRFDDAQVNPLEYFTKHANGMFLWVTLAFQQLLVIKSKAGFKHCLERLSTATNDMSKLYLEILLKIEGEDRQWLKEILHWVFVAQREPNIEFLRLATEYTIDDELENFQHFLEIECGSLLQFIRESDLWTTVQFVHETFRSFLTDSRICPTDLFISEATTHGRATLTCLRVSCDSAQKPTIFKDYGTRLWPTHLSKSCTSEPITNEILISLHKFFTSDELMGWIDIRLLDYYGSIGCQYALKSVFEDEDMQAVSDWLKQIEFQDAHTIIPSDGFDLATFEASVQWREAVLLRPDILGEYIGKAAARMWLNGTADESKHATGSFVLALKHYWRRPNRIKSNSEETRELIETKFEGLIQWSGQIITGKPSERQFAVAFKCLDQWHHYLSCYKSLDMKDADLMLWTGVGKAYFEAGDYQNAMDIYKQALEKFPDEISLYQSLGDVYNAVRDHEKAIESYWRGLEEGRMPSITNAYSDNEVSKAFRAIGDSDGLIDFYETAIEKNIPDNPWFSFPGFPNNTGLWHCFGEACKVRGKYTRLINRYQNEMENSFGRHSQDLADAYLSMGDFDAAIQVYEKALELSPDNQITPHNIFHTYNQKGDYDGAIEHSHKLYKTAVDRDPRNAPYAVQDLGQALQNKGLYDEAIKVYEHVLQDHPETVFIWCRLGKTYIERGDFAAAENVFLKGLTTVRDTTYIEGLWVELGSTYEAMHRYQCALDAYMKGIANSGRISSLFKRFEMLCTKKSYFNELAMVCQSQIMKTPDNSELWTSLYLACEKNGDSLTFSSCFEKIIGQTTDDSTIRSLCQSIGEICVGQRDWDQAIKIYSRAPMKDLPADNDIYVALGKAYQGYKDYDRSIELFRAAIDENPFDCQLLNALGSAYVGKCDYDAAIAVYNLAIEKKPMYSWYWSALGDVYRDKGDLDQAIEVYQMGIKRVATSSDLQIRIGQVFMTRGDWGRAVKAFQTAVVDDSSSPEAWKCLTAACLAGGCGEVLIQEYKSAIWREEISRESWLWSSLHIACMEQSNFDGLIGCYNDALQRNPYRWRLWNHLGHAYKAAGNPKSAIASYYEAIKLRPGNYDSRVRVAKTHEAEGNYLEAIKVYKSVLDTAPTEHWFRWHLGQAYGSIRNYEEAIALFEFGTEKFPTITLLWDGLATSYSLKGENEKAIMTYKKGIEKNPAASWLGLGLGNIYQSAGEYRNAITAYETAIKDTENSFLWGLINTCKPDLDEDFDIDNSLLLMFPWVRLISCYNEIGESSNASELYRTVISSYEKVLRSSDDNDLLWKYKHDIPCDTFWRTNLPKPIIWAILGEAYNANGEYVRAAEAYKRGLMGPAKNSAWLQNRLSEANKFIDEANAIKN